MNENRPKKRQIRALQWRAAFMDSDLSSTTRHVLHALSGFMADEGDECFPSIAIIADKCSLDRKTIRTHLAIAELKGWLRVESAGFRGQQWRRKQYVARWPDGGAVDDFGAEGEGAVPPPHAKNSVGEVGEFLPQGGGTAPHKVGELRPVYKTSPNTSPLNSSENGAGVRALSPAQKKRNDRLFKRWISKWPRHEDYSYPAARSEWDRMTEAERQDSIRLTPAFIRANDVTTKPFAPALFLRERLWKTLPAGNVAQKQMAKSFSRLWMAQWLWTLEQASRQPVRLAPFDQRLIDSGRASLDDLHRQAMAKHCAGAVEGMLQAARRRVEWRCSSFLEPISESFQWVEPNSELLAAWRRLHERRAWQWFAWVPSVGMQFPAIDPATNDLDAAVEAAMTDFARQVSEVLTNAG